MPPSRAKKAKTTKTPTSAVDGELVSLLRMDDPTPKNPLRERTEAALRRKADKHAAKVADQVKAFYNFMGPLADQGLCEGEYRKDLCEEARTQLRKEGIKLTDHGENVCSLFTAKW